MPSMFDTQPGSRQASAADEQPSTQPQGNVPGQANPLQTNAPDIGLTQNWDTFHQHMLLVVQATQNLGAKLTAIFNP